MAPPPLSSGAKRPQPHPVQARTGPSIDVDTVCRDLIGLDGEKGLAFADAATLLNLNLFDRAALGHEDLGCASGGHEIADRSLLARVLGDEEEQCDCCSR